MTSRARRMSESTRGATLDRRAETGREGELCAGGVRIPRAGSTRVVIDDRPLQLTHLDRVLWPAAGFTKADLIAYYLNVADVLLPHLRDRPLTLGRFPGGVDGRGFAQTEIPGRPGWIRTVPLALKSGAVKRFTLADERASLAWLAQMGTIELHTFLAAWPDVDRPTTVVFDLDPAGPGGVVDAARVALMLRDRVVDAGLEPFVKTSGSAGMHVLVPVAAPVTYAETHAFARRLAAAAAAEMPDLVTDRLPRAERAGRVLVDVRQNARRLTTVVPYSLRTTDRPTVSMPVAWSEVASAVATGYAGSMVFEAAAAIARVGRDGDLLRPMAASGARLPPADPHDERSDA
jgi:bifunctional non-homologous end joining protein LigD